MLNPSSNWEPMLFDVYCGKLVQKFPAPKEVYAACTLPDKVDINLVHRVVKMMQPWYMMKRHDSILVSILPLDVLEREKQAN